MSMITLFSAFMGLYVIVRLILRSGMNWPLKLILSLFALACAEKLLLTKLVYGTMGAFMPEPVQLASGYLHSAVAILFLLLVARDALLLLTWPFRRSTGRQRKIFYGHKEKKPASGFWAFTLVLLALLLGVIAVVLIRFFGTSLGLSIRATGDSLDMVSASSINPKATITIGLCLANALTALAGCLIGEYNKFCDINLGTGMVTIALASLIIGEVFAGRRGGIGKRVVCVVLGSIVYRLIIALALRLNISAEYFKLVSAVIVAVAIAAPNMKDYVHLAKIRSNARKLRALSGKGDETDA